MTLKTLLLGSAAAFAVVGGAQAADLSVAEPVESVRICDAFAGGYWYIPTTDTCLKVGGNVEFDVNLHPLSGTYTTHSSNWDFQTAIGLTFDAKSVIDIGTLEGHVALQAKYDGAGTPSTVTLDGAYLKIGALQAGHFGSPFKPGSGFVDYNNQKSAIADNNKLQLGWAAAGFGIVVGIEDPRETWGSSLPDTWSMPLITGAITASSGSVAGSCRLASFSSTAAVRRPLLGACPARLISASAPTTRFACSPSTATASLSAAAATGSTTVGARLRRSPTCSARSSPSTSTTRTSTRRVVGPTLGRPLLTWSGPRYSGFQGKLRAGWNSSNTWAGQVVLKRSW